MAYCGQCPSYPCERYTALDAADSFVTHRRRREDMERLGRVGPQAFHEELARREEILLTLLRYYNDGRRKNLFCLAANLLELPELERALERIREETGEADMPVRERAACASRILQASAAKQGVELKLRKRPKEK